MHPQDAGVLVHLEALRNRFAKHAVQVGGRMQLSLVVPTYPSEVLERQGRLIGPLDRASGAAGCIELIGEPRDVLLALGVEESRHADKSAVDAGFAHERRNPVNRITARLRHLARAALAKIADESLITAVNGFGEMTGRVAGLAAANRVAFENSDAFAGARQDERGRQA